MDAFSVTPSGAGFGARIEGVDLSGPMTEETRGAVRAAFAEHGVLWFADQRIDDDALECFTLAMGEFGEDPFIAALPGRPHVIEVRREPDETASVFGTAWHSDWSFQERPPAATLLHARVVPPSGGDTLFCDAKAAFEALSPAFQAMLAPLAAIHSASRPYGPKGFYAKEGARKGMTILPAAAAEARTAHPLVRTHPETGARSLFVNPVYTVGIEGFEKAEADALLSFLFAHMTAERFVYRLKWGDGMLVMWDNRRLNHNATGGYDGHRRVMHRTTLAGDRPR
ncbi:MAG: TauD/TfdA dioxygenase family protein [Caulobacteraceae bacterium]